MPIDVYDGRTLLMSIAEDSFLRLDAAQHELRTRAGRSIDPYGTSTLESSHAQLWLTGLRRVLPSLRNDATTQATCQQIIETLTNTIARGATLIIDGE